MLAPLIYFVVAKHATSPVGFLDDVGYDSAQRKDDKTHGANRAASKGDRRFPIVNGQPRTDVVVALNQGDRVELPPNVTAEYAVLNKNAKPVKGKSKFVVFPTAKPESANATTQDDIDNAVGVVNSSRDEALEASSGIYSAGVPGAPKDPNLGTTLGSPTLSWVADSHASAYVFTCYAGSDSVPKKTLTTTTTSVKLEMPLAEGSYKWKVVGLKGGTQLQRDSESGSFRVPQQLEEKYIKSELSRIDRSYRQSPSIVRIAFELRAGLYKNAVSDARHLVERDPGSASAKLVLMNCLNHLGRADLRDKIKRDLTAKGAIKSE